jgi:hypothetical protein
MPAGLGALRDDHIGPGLHRFPRLSQGLHLTDQFRACPVDGRREWAWVAEGQHNSGRLMGECSIQELWMLREAPGDEAATNSRITGESPFAFDATVISVTATEQAQAACEADCGGEPTARDEVHWSQQNRVLDSEYPGQSIADGHLSLLPPCDREQSWNNAAQDGKGVDGTGDSVSSLDVS